MPYFRKSEKPPLAQVRLHIAEAPLLRTSTFRFFLYTKQCLNLKILQQMLEHQGHLVIMGGVEDSGITDRIIVSQLGSVWRNRSIADFKNVSNFPKFFIVWLFFLQLRPPPEEKKVLCGPQAWLLRSGQAVSGSLLLRRDAAASERQGIPPHREDPTVFCSRLQKRNSPQTTREQKWQEHF